MLEKKSSITEINTKEIIIEFVAQIAYADNIKGNIYYLGNVIGSQCIDSRLSVP